MTDLRAAGAVALGFAGAITQPACSQGFQVTHVSDDIGAWVSVSTDCCPPGGYDAAVPQVADGFAVAVATSYAGTEPRISRADRNLVVNGDTLRIDATAGTPMNGCCAGTGVSGEAWTSGCVRGRR